MTEPAPAPVPTPRRRGLAQALVPSASILAFAAILAVRVNRQALNTDMSGEGRAQPPAPLVQ
jgi:hypothetical protein